MDYITTYSGTKLDVINPDLNAILIEDIAHSLSFMCRANGHCLYFYSVAQHSINCAIEAKARGFSKKIQLACLLHDASEAYMADIVRPYKKHLPEYLVFEEKLQNTIWFKFGIKNLTKEEYDTVFYVDDLILYNEFNVTMRENTLKPLEQAVGNVDFTKCDMQDIEQKFLDLFKDIVNEI